MVNEATGAEGETLSGAQKGTTMSNRSVPTFDEIFTAVPTRRTLLKAGAAAIAVGGTGLGAGLAKAQDSSDAATAAASPATCVLNAEMTEGPYFLEGDLIRKDITEGVAGIPLQLKISVQDVNACAALANAAVDIWHCDAQGYYSGISGENPGGGGAATTDENLTTTFLRGIQLTGDDGVAEFTTIYPGWYTGRTIHIHMKVVVDGTADDTYEGGHVSHTGQLFFDDDISDKVYASGGAYVGRDDSQRLRNDADNILGDHADEPGFLLALTGSVDEGFVGTITIGVDPTATPSGVGVGGGGDGGNGGPPSGGPGGTPPQGA
jgi:protocatechuate 3,4-dioxygenase beta subunit